MEDAILAEMHNLCEILEKSETQKPIDLCFKTNLSIVNALWMIISGQRFDLDDQGTV